MIKNRLYIYKANKEEYVDVSDSVQSINYDAGSVWETGDSYADNPSTTLSVTLKNDNNHLYSPNFEKGKIKFNNSYSLNLISGQEYYDLPNDYTLEIISNNYNYNVFITRGQIQVFPIPTTNEILELSYCYIDTTILNEINYIDTEFSPLINEYNMVKLWQDTINFSFFDYLLIGNDTDELIIYNTGNLKYINIDGTFANIKPNNYYEICQENYYVKSQENFYKLSRIDEGLKEYKEGFFQLSMQNYFELSNLNYKELCDISSDDTLEIISYTKNGNEIKLKFNRKITTNELVKISANYENITESYLKFDGYITGSSDTDIINSCTFNCQDRAYDLIQKILTVDSTRNYDADSKDDNDYDVLAETTIDLNLVSKVSTTSNFDYTEFFTLNEQIALFDGTNYLYGTISGLNATSITLTSTDTIADGVYRAYKVYPNAIPVTTYMQNCLNDTGLNYIVGSLNAYSYNFLPKSDDMQYDDVWNHFQDLIIKTGNITFFKNINNEYQLVVMGIPETTGTPKYHIKEKDILNSSKFNFTGEYTRTSFMLTYYNYESGEYVETVKIVDDFIQSPYAVTIPSERAIINTDELLKIGKYIRINNDYYIVKKILTSSKYVLNKPVLELDTDSGFTGYTLYTQGQYTDKYGFKIATITLDSSSSIDTDIEATNYLNRCLAQTVNPLGTYQLVLNAEDFRMDNFDTIKVTSPKLSLFGEDLFVQSVSESYSDTSKTLTITLEKFITTGKYKLKEAITERGSNTVTTSNKMTTQVTIKAPKNLKAYEPSIDDLQNYKYYSLVDWDDIIGQYVARYEIEYKKATDDWTNKEVLTTTDTSIKIFPSEATLYDVRVRAIGKESKEGLWANAQVDFTKYLLENPIQNGTWYIRLFKGNDEEEYFGVFDTLGYTNQYLIDNIDTIEIVPNADKGNKSENYVLWKKNKFTTFPNRIETGLEKSIINRTSSTPNKNLYFNSVPNGYYKFEGDYISGSGGLYGALDTKIFKNIKGINNNVIFRPFNSIKVLENRDADFGDIREVSDLTIICFQSDNIGLDCRAVDEYYADVNNARITYKNINVETHNYTTGITIGFTSNKLENCICKDFDSLSIGFYRSNFLKGCKAINCDIGFQECHYISYNNAINCTTKYDTCYASSNKSVPIPSGGSDTAQYGWNI